jgi:hypothetical protein
VTAYTVMCLAVEMVGYMVANSHRSVLLQHRTTGDDPPGPDWVAIPGPGGLVKEVKERKVKSREEREERIETEDVQHLGDLTDEVSGTFTWHVTLCSYR